MIGLHVARPTTPATRDGAFEALVQPRDASPRLRLSAPAVQPRLKVGDPADPLEREADAMAERVMRSPAPCQACAARDDEEDTVRRQARSPFSPDEGLLEEDEQDASAGIVRAKSSGAGVAPVNSPAPASGLAALRSGGDPLPAPLRRFMEPRFGHDFSQVRIHTGRTAEDSARRLQARAFTLGRDVVFGRGEYAPAGAEGRRLIAHELTHVVQQGRAAPLPARGAVVPAPLARDDEGGAIRRVAWTPNRRTGRRSSPWGAGGPAGQVLEAATDAGTALDIWQPDDGSTYWCHGFTFGGPAARGGPYSIWGQDVPTVLADDGWRPTYACMAQPADIMVFSDAGGNVAHSGIIRSVVSPGARVDEAASTVESKWGAGSLNTSSWETNVNQYGRYTCYSKSPLTGVCDGQGENER